MATGLLHFFSAKHHDGRPVSYACIECNEGEEHLDYDGIINLTKRAQEQCDDDVILSYLGVGEQLYSTPIR
jgi:hypothetical protein